MRTVIADIVVSTLSAVMATGIVGGIGAHTDRASAAPAPSQAGVGGSSLGGNLVVVVPPVPAHRALKPLCQILLFGPMGTKPGPSGPSNTVEDLVLSTGGTRVSAVKWCRGYLGLDKPGHQASRRPMSA